MVPMLCVGTWTGTLERLGMRSHAERGNDALIFLFTERGLDAGIKSLIYFVLIF